MYLRVARRRRPDPMASHFGPESDATHTISCRWQRGAARERGARTSELEVRQRRSPFGPQRGPPARAGRGRAGGPRGGAAGGQSQNAVHTPRTTAGSPVPVSIPVALSVPATAHDAGGPSSGPHALHTPDRAARKARAKEARATGGVERGVYGRERHQGRPAVTVERPGGPAAYPAFKNTPRVDPRSRCRPARSSTSYPELPAPAAVAWLRCVRR